MRPASARLTPRRLGGRSRPGNLDGLVVLLRIVVGRGLCRVARPWGAIAVTLLAALTSVVLTACDSGEDEDGERSTTTTAESTTSTTTREAAVEAAYAKFWDTYIEFGGRTGPFDPDEAKTVLGAVSTGDKYEQLFNYFQVNRLKGLVLRGRPENAPKLDVTLEGADRATVKDCMADTGGIYRADTGERVDTPTTGRQLVTATLVLEGGAWKVESLGGEEPCSL